MDSFQKQLERLMSLNPDTELHFDDGVLPANSNVLSFFSSVLHSAIEAHSEGDKDISTIVIPMKGVTMAQWLKVAPFWHPVEPAAVVHTWADAELLLRIGSRFDLRPALDKATEFLAVNVNTLTVSSSGSSSADLSLWKWLQLADELRLSSSIPALVNRAVTIDRAGCSARMNIKGLSSTTLQQLVCTLVRVPPTPFIGQQVPRSCSESSSARQVVCLKCTSCCTVHTS
jgi:hypothetical protein